MQHTTTMKLVWGSFFEQWGWCVDTFSVCCSCFVARATSADPSGASREKSQQPSFFLAGLTAVICCLICLTFPGTRNVFLSFGTHFFSIIPGASILFPRSFPFFSFLVSILSGDFFRWQYSCDPLLHGRATGAIAAPNLCGAFPQLFL